jgi:hypothetical protein
MKRTLLILGNVVLGAGFSFAQQTPVSQSPQNKNVVLEELTGINCQYCPAGHLLAKQISDANPNRVVLVNIHAGGFAAPGAGQPDLRTTAGTALDAFLAPEGYPAGAVQRTAFGIEEFLATGRENWTSQIAARLTEASPVNMAMDATIDAATRVLTLNVEMFYTTPQAAGTNQYLNIGYVQNNFEGPQTAGATYNPAAVLPNGNYLHQHMFRGFLNAGGTPGEAIDASQTGVITRTVTYTLPAAINGVDLNIGELEFFAFLHEGQNTFEDSKIISAAEVTPTYVNVPAATAILQSINNEFNIGCATNGSISPIVKVKNSGDAISALSFSSTVNGGAPVVYNWTGNIPAFGTADITIPALNFSPVASNSVTVTLTSVNGGAGTVGATASASKNITKAATATGTMITLEIMTDNYPAETTWQLLNSSNTAVANGGPYVGNGQNAGGADALKTKTHDITLPGSDCYSLKLMDSYGDGFTYGTNPAGGYGFRIKQGANTLYTNLKAPFDFGGATTVDGVLNFVLGINENEEVLTMFNIYPNPAQNEATLDIATNNNSKVSYQVVNALGQVVIADDLGTVNGQKTVNVNTSKLNGGMYFVNITINGVSTQKPLSIIK